MVLFYTSIPDTILAQNDTYAGRYAECICITPCYIRTYTKENKNHKTYLNKLYTCKSSGNFKCV